MHDYFIDFQRYQPIVDDWPAFQETIFRPLPTCIWANPLRTTPEQLAQWLAAEKIPFEPLPWYPGGFKLSPDFKPGYHWAFLAGLYHVQEEVSMLPVMLLEPQPGERILDLCAAPGNKTAQMALFMANQGTVVANDINFGRMRAARQTLERLGLVNVTTTIGNGANYPNTAGLFDRVLVDVPCTCEGTSRKASTGLQQIGPGFSRKKSGVQRALLRTAVRLCKPGGRIVYATCTFAPEENELVVEDVLREYGEALRVVPAHLQELTVSPGLTEWQGQQLQPSLRQTLRIWPHQNDTGGFYVAVLEKEKSASLPAGMTPPDEQLPLPTGEEWHPDWRPANSSPAATAALEQVMERFGISPTCLESYYLFQQGKRRLYLVNPDHHRPPVQPEPDASGMLCLRLQRKYSKLSTAAAMVFGNQATRNYVDLNNEQVAAYTRRQEFQLSADQSRACTGLGYVLVRYQGFTLGVALYLPDHSGQGGLIRSLFPSGWSPTKE